VPAGSPSTNPRHQRKLSDIPAVVLSPAGSPGQTTPLLAGQSLPLPQNPSYSPTHAPIPLDLNAFPIPAPSTPEQTPQQAVLASPEFWEGFYAFLQAQFGGRIDDSNAAFEEFLLSAKNKLTPHEIARIRDRVGVIGMGGN
jgi:ubiquitin-like protein 4